MAKGNKVGVDSSSRELKESKVELAKIRLAAWVAAFGCGILVAGIALPPLGVIDNSVLIAAGEVFVFSASIMGIKLSYEFKMKELATKVKQLEDEEDNHSNS